MRGIRWEKQQFAPRHCHKIDRQSGFVECGVIEDDDGSGLERWQKLRGQPFVEDIGVACAFEGHGRDQLFGAIPADQAGARTLVAGDVAVNFLPDEGPSMRAAHRRREARFINKNYVALLLRDLIEVL